MTSAVRADAPPAVADQVAVAGAAGVAAMAAFRLGILPGGLVGVDVVLALLGWWLASPLAADEHHRDRLVRAWRLVWVPTFAVVALAVVWVLLRDPVGLDDTVRGEGLAAFGGYANWHQWLLGPAETLATRARSPLQHLWAPAVAAQAVLVWWLVGAWQRRRLVRRPEATDRRAVVLALLGTASFAVGLGLLASGASGQTLLLCTVPRATAFFLGAALGAATGTEGGELARSIAAGNRWFAAVGLGLCAVFAGPATTFGRIAGVTLVPVFAVVLAGAAIPAPGAVRRSPPPAAWSLLVAAWFLLTPLLAIARAALGDAPTVVVDGLGLVATAVLVVPLAFACDRLSTEPKAVERRRVLAPPAAVLLLVVLGSVTGAFHWEGPQPVDDWPHPAVDVMTVRPGTEPHAP